MKVLLAFPQNDKQTGLFVKKAFEALGCELEINDPKINPHQLYEQAKRFNPDLIFCSRTPSLVNSIKKIKNELPSKIVCYNTDVRSGVNGFISDFGNDIDLFFNLMDFIYVKKGLVNDFQSRYKKTKVEFLPQGIDSLVHKKEKFNIEDKNKYSCDVMFAGSISNIHKGRKALLTHVNNMGIHYKRYTNIFDCEHNKACMYSKITLGHCGFPEIAISNSVRDFKVMGAGGFLLTEYTKDLEELYDIGNECETYTTIKECDEKIKYYLSHEQERLTIAENGYNITHKNHTYINRMKSVINNIEGDKK
jgi:hypothetical protein